MSPLPVTVIQRGVEQMPPPSYELRAGPLTMLYTGGDLRYIRLGSHEILRRIYAAVRDHTWNTAPVQVNNQRLHIHETWFRIAYEAVHRLGEIDFFAEVSITGERDGTIVFTLDGEARATFRTNRTGFCVLHPMTLAGMPCVVEHVDGRVTEGAFPAQIAPHQPFYDIRAVTHQVMRGVQAEVRMEGDAFEMEDQRNWTDASFKTYSRPHALPFPYTLEAGQRVHQSVTLRLAGTLPEAYPEDRVATTTHTLTVSQHAMPLPGLGLAVSAHPLNGQETGRLNSLRLAHLRAELRLWQADTADALRKASADAGALELPLELVVYVSEDAQRELTALRSLLVAMQPGVARWLILHRDEPTTSAPWVALARDILGDLYSDALFGAGTDSDFTALNRHHPPVDAIDFAAFTANPQVHAFTDRDLVENLAPQAQVAAQARAISGGKPVYVTPVTLKKRSSPTDASPAPETLPPSVDPRQMSLLGAGWTLGSIKYLAEGGAAGITYYETTGWLGVMERPDGPPLPSQFPALPGSVFPLYHVLADLADFTDGELLHCVSDAPLAVEGLVMRKHGYLRLLLANFTPEVRSVRVEGLRAGDAPLSVVVKALDETNAHEAMANPEAWRALPGVRVAFGATWQHALQPYAVVRVDVQ